MPGETINSDNSQNTEEGPQFQSFEDHMKELSSSSQETARQKQFFETEITFEDPAEFRELLLNADEDETREILEKRLAFLEESCDKPSELRYGGIHEGFIGKETDIHFQRGLGSEIISHYKIKDYDYAVDAITYLQHNKEKIHTSKELLFGVGNFLNSYFGYPPQEDKRTEYIDSQIGESLQNTATDEEFFEIIDNIDIAVFKGQNVAMCTERAAMAQNILSVFGHEARYVNGLVAIDGREEHHAFNLVGSKKGSNPIICDFSILSSTECDGVIWNAPTPTKIPNYNGFLQGEKAVGAMTETHIFSNDGRKERRRVHTLEYGV